MRVITGQGGVFQYKPLRTSICSHTDMLNHRDLANSLKAVWLLFLVSCHAIQSGDPQEPVDVGSTEKQWGIAEPDNCPEAGKLTWIQDEDAAQIDILIRGSEFLEKASSDNFIPLR